MARASDEDQAGGVRVEAMGRAGLLRIVNLLEYVLERVAIETSAGMHGERGGFVEDDDGFVFVKDLDVGVDVRLGEGGEFLKITFASVDDVGRRDGLASAIEHETALAEIDPFGGGHMLEDAIEKFQKRGAFAIGGDTDGTEIIVSNAAGKRRGDATDGGVARFEGEAFLFVRCFKAIGTTFTRDEAGILLVLCVERGETGEALVGFGFVQRRIDADALVENETFAVVMRAATFLEILENAAIELENVFEPSLLHERGGFFATDATGAEGDDGLVLEFRRQLRDGFGEIAEVIDAGGEGVFESAELDFVIVAGVQERDGAAFIEPLLEGGRRDARRGVASGIDAFNAERDDFLFDAHEHPVERLVIAFAEFNGEISEPRDGTELGSEFFDARRETGDEEIDAFGAEEDGALEIPFLAAGKEVRAQLFEVVERRELVCSDVVEHRHRARGSRRYGRDEN